MPTTSSKLLHGSTVKTWAVLQMHELPHVHLPACKVPKSPNMSTSPLSTNSIVPLYDGSSHAPARMDALPSHARCLFPEGDYY